ncbi:hypothetical protein L6164_010660 [Bauhinia variegata]|uniref:Uncharacterized protein n=1 Tax=Bauhinia variegata TaxID=167791 RepID=A0ACB9PP01_BAUVA|nr:hypothetical protein L6164_010660 [Bauhinia variegata]
MANLVLLLSRLRRCRQSSTLSVLSVAYASELINPKRLPTSQPRSYLSPPPVDTYRPYLLPRLSTLTFCDAFHSRAYSTSTDDSDIDRIAVNPGSESLDDSELFNERLSRVIDDVTAGITNGEEYIFPVRAVISMLDGYHDLTGLPWWIIIASSTLALRIVLFPMLIFQLHKSNEIGEFVFKLPSPFPPPLSGRSYIDQFLHFRKERKAIGCPSYLWHFSFVALQVPCFLLWMTSIRRMSLDGHPGFDCGGTLWFQNLTEFPHGYSGFIFPFLVAGLHLINVRISFKNSSVEKASGVLALLAYYYKWYLHLLALPIGFIGFCIPQGSLVYWVTNSSLTIFQQLSLKHPAVLEKLGLLVKNSQKAPYEETDAPKTMGSRGLQDNNIPVAASEEMGAPKMFPVDSPEKWFKIPIENLSPNELISLAVPFISSKDKESAMPLLKLALDKDPENLRAMVLMGRVLLLKHLNTEANEYLERAISKLSFAGNPTEVEEVDLLILASQWAGVICERQGKRAESLLHFERIANMAEPDDPSSKAHYFDGLLLFASTLFDGGQRDEAAKYLRLVVAYNPAYRKFLEKCEQDDDIASDLANSRREL